MTKNASVLLGILILATGCGTDPSDRSDGHESFDAFAGAVFEDLQYRPLGDSIAVETGLFGDLNVMSGEHVVMGRYRYRIDTLHDHSVGHLAFLVRALEGGEPVPVQFTFDRENGVWKLREAQRVSEPGGGGSKSRLEEALDQHLSEWARKAVERVHRR